MRYDANEQSLFAALADGTGETLLLHRTHERHAPHALDAIAAALDGRFGALRHVAGALDWQDGVPRIEPWALACDHLVVPDFAAHSGALPAVLLGRADDGAADGCTLALDGLGQHLATALHNGARRLPPRWRQEGEYLARALAAAGLQELSQRLQALQSVLGADAAPTTATARAFMTLSALRQLHQDAMETQRASAAQQRRDAT